MGPPRGKIDAHTHILAEGKLCLDIMDAAGVEKAALLCMGMTDRESYQRWEDSCFDLAQQHPDRFFVLPTIDLTEIDHPDFVQRTLDHLNANIERGAKGVKVLKDLGLTARDSAGNLLAVDDERLDPVWDKAGKAGLPVLIHTADPEPFWNPVDERNPYCKVLQQITDWVYYGKRLPSHRELLAQRDRVIARHPSTTFIGAHIASDTWDLDSAAAVLDSFPNLFVDTAAREDELGAQPDKSRQFLLTYQDRVLFGTDLMSLAPVAGDNLRQWMIGFTTNWYDAIARLYESEDANFPAPSSHSWTVSGLNLPDGVLDKLYLSNAKRLFGV